MYHDPLVTRVGVPAWLVPTPLAMPLAASDVVRVGALDLSDFSDADGEDDEGDSDCEGGAPQGTFIRNHARSGAAVQAWHDCVPSAADRDALAADAANLVLKVGARTFWLDDETTPHCALEVFALAVRDFHAPRCVDATGQPLRICGVEWWVQARESDGMQPSLGLHWDAGGCSMC